MSSQPEPLALKDLTALLIRHYGLHDGLWDLAVEMQIAAGRMGQTPDQALPGAMFLISRIGLQKSETAGPGTVDAATVNPSS